MRTLEELTIMCANRFSNRIRDGKPFGQTPYCLIESNEKLLKRSFAISRELDEFLLSKAIGRYCYVHQLPDDTFYLRLRTPIGIVKVPYFLCKSWKYEKY